MDHAEPTTCGKGVASLANVTSKGVPSVARRAVAGLGLLVLAASLVVGSNLLGARDRVFGSATPPAKASAFSRVATGAPASGGRRTVLRSEAWWQEVGRFTGAAGSTRTRAFAIGPDVIQWRMRWSCGAGRFVVRAAGGGRPVVDAPCAGVTRTTEVTTKVEGGLQVAAGGPWRMQVQQQVDVPLDEPPLPAMSAPGARRTATASVYRIDQVGKGRLTFYRLADGRRALRLDGFYVTPNVDLEIRLSPLRNPRSTKQYLSAPSRLVQPLDVTAGSMNFAVPDGVDPSRFRSVVIWCDVVRSAYAAATLHPAR